jgi:tetratricopeptide (TPR) repeat protein
MIIYEDEWTIIFNKDYEAWGSYFYEEANDALRIKVKPQDVAHREWLQFGFENLTPNSADVYMHWGKKKVSFNLSINQHEVVLAKYRDELTNLPGFNQAAWGNAARYCLQNNVNTDEAMTWIEKALTMNGGNNFNNLSIKAGLLSLQGKEKEGDQLLESSIEMANENELNLYGYQLMGQNRLNDAIKIFKLNIKRHPDSWNVYDSLGEAFANKGDKKAAKKNYEIAYDKAPANQKARIEGILKGL